MSRCDAGVGGVEAGGEVFAGPGVDAYAGAAHLADQGEEPFRHPHVELECVRLAQGDDVLAFLEIGTGAHLAQAVTPEKGARSTVLSSRAWASATRAWAALRFSRASMMA